MSLIPGLFAFFCTSFGMTGQYNTACNKSFEAGSKQVGIYQLGESTEMRATSYATTMGKDNLGQPIMDVGSVGVFAFRYYHYKSVNLKLPTMGMADAATAQLTTNSGNISLKWNIF